MSIPSAPEDALRMKQDPANQLTGAQSDAQSQETSEVDRFGFAVLTTEDDGSSSDSDEEECTSVANSQQFAAASQIMSMSRIDGSADKDVHQMNRQSQQAALIQGTSDSDSVLVEIKNDWYPGKVRHRGTTYFATGEWFGIELDAPVGKNDGTVLDHAYFSCKTKHGVFVRREKLQSVLPDGSTTAYSGAQSTDRSMSPETFRRNKRNQAPLSAYSQLLRCWAQGEWRCMRVVGCPSDEACPIGDFRVLCTEVMDPLIPDTKGPAEANVHIDLGSTDHYAEAEVVSLRWGSNLSTTADTVCPEVSRDVAKTRRICWKGDVNPGLYWIFCASEQIEIPAHLRNDEDAKMLHRAIFQLSTDGCLDVVSRVGGATIVTGTITLAPHGWTKFLPPTEDSAAGGLLKLYWDPSDRCAHHPALELVPHNLQAAPNVVGRTRWALKVLTDEVTAHTRAAFVYSLGQRVLVYLSGRRKPPVCATVMQLSDDGHYVLRIDNTHKTHVLDLNEMNHQPAAEYMYERHTKLAVLIAHGEWVDAAVTEPPQNRGDAYRIEYNTGHHHMDLNSVNHCMARLSCSVFESERSRYLAHVINNARVRLLSRPVPLRLFQVSAHTGSFLLPRRSGMP